MHLARLSCTWFHNVSILRLVKFSDWGMTLQFLLVGQNEKPLAKSNKAALQLILGICSGPVWYDSFTESLFMPKKCPWGLFVCCFFLTYICMKKKSSTKVYLFEFSCILISFTTSQQMSSSIFWKFIFSVGHQLNSLLTRWGFFFLTSLSSSFSYLIGLSLLRWREVVSSVRRQV